MTQISFTPSPQLYPFESRWFDSSVGRVHYVDEGSGRPILLLHGNPTWSFTHRNVILGLRDRFRCVAPDYPGFGLSDHPDDYGYTPAEHARVVEELVRHLDLGDLIVATAPDWGGPIGMAVAVSVPDRVAGLVLGNNWFWPSTPWIRTFGHIMSSRPMQRAILKGNFFVERVIPIWTSRKLSAEEMEHYRAVLPTPESRKGVAELPRQLLAAAPWLDELSTAVREELSDKRVLIVWSRRGHTFPPWMIARMQEYFSDSVVVKLRTTQHYMQENEPEAIVRAIGDRFA